MRSLFAVIIIALATVCGLFRPAHAQCGSAQFQPGQTCGNNGAAQALPGPINGADTNALNTQTANYAITAADCGRTVQAGTGSTGFFTVTLPSVSGLPASCSVLVKNGDTTRGKGLSGFPSDLNNVLWPQQSVGVKIVNGAWASFYQPGRYNVTSVTNIFFDPINGSDNNDCLASGTSACATVAHAGVIYSQQWLVNAEVVIRWPTGAHTYNNATNADYFDVPPYIGSGNVVLLGNQGTPDNVHIQMTSVANAVFSFNYVGGLYQVAGFKIDSSVGSGNGNGILVAGSTQVQYNSMDFGAFAGGNMVVGEFAAQVQTNGNNTISGGAAVYLLCTDSAVCHDTADTDTLTGTPAFSTAFLWAHGPGAVIGTLAAVFSGSATGVKCKADAAGYVDVDTPSSLPGNSACVVSSAGAVAGVSGLANPIIGPLAFSALPASPVVGQMANIADGKASNCVDTTCTTFGTAITGGGGALPLFSWYNGSNWTLIGK